ncbi:hypothetical protein [Metabacillus sp. FJAT-52054]|uniref:Uncharacterized protein n=1 Tax=Metabacillus sediminis TaxID=3117746 RepID=A0ABZ2NMR9_9BACI
MNLHHFNKQYEQVMHSGGPKDKVNRELADLMSQMEKAFKIPMMASPKWEKENRAVIALYRKISMSRSL